MLALLIIGVINRMIILVTWGEPSCWACGKFNGELDIDLDELDGIEVFGAWDKHKYLQRCHIVPKALGGCNCEANLVLMCKECHQKSPDTKKPIHFVNWVRNRRLMYIKEIEYAMMSVDYTAEEDDYILVLSEEFKSYLKANTVIVSGKLTKSSYFAAFLEFKESIDFVKRKHIVEQFKIKGSK